MKNINIEALKIGVLAISLCAAFSCAVDAKRAYGRARDKELKAVCISILDDCEEFGVMPKGEAQRYDSLRTVKKPSLSELVRLVGKCEEAACFYDTVGGTDAWQEYCEKMESGEMDASLKNED